MRKWLFPFVAMSFVVGMLSGCRAVHNLGHTAGVCDCDNAIDDTCCHRAPWVGGPCLPRYGLDSGCGNGNCGRGGCGNGNCGAGCASGNCANGNCGIGNRGNGNCANGACNNNGTAVVNGAPVSTAPTMTVPAPTTSAPRATLFSSRPRNQGTVQTGAVTTSNKGSKEIVAITPPADTVPGSLIVTTPTADQIPASPTSR